MATAVNDLTISSNVIDGFWSRQIFVDGTSTGAIASVAPALTVQPNIPTITGVLPQLNTLDLNIPNFADFNIYHRQVSLSYECSWRIDYSPKGTGASGAKSRLYFSELDFKTNGLSNYSLAFMGMTGTEFNISTVAGGSGTPRPITMTAGTVPSIKINTSASVAGNVLLNNTTDNSTAFLQVTNSAQPQAAFHYDASHYTTFTTGSTGALTITPSISGGTIRFGGYGSGTNTGTAAFGLSVTSGGRNN